MDPTAAMEAFREILRVRRLLDERARDLDPELRAAVLAMGHSYADLVDQHASVMRAFKPSSSSQQMPRAAVSTPVPPESNGNGAYPGEYRYREAM